MCMPLGASHGGRNMLRSILVPASGSETDGFVFETALAVARPFGAHLQFLHVHLSPAAASLQVPHFEFCHGTAVHSTLQELRTEGDHLACTARLHFEQFCSLNSVHVRDAPGSMAGVTASLTEAIDEPLATLVSRARHSDLIVLGRQHNQDHMPNALIESLLIGGGRPLLIAYDLVPRNLTRTVVVGWKETPEAARALTAAMPLLRVAERVVLLCVAEAQAVSRPTYDDLVRQLAWHGVSAEVSVVDGAGSWGAAMVLAEAALRLHADLLVVGGFGRAPVREYIFGGVTRSLIDEATFPVFMVH
jgi:nucleotide-binding universal stress UspA family protein